MPSEFLSRIVVYSGLFSRKMCGVHLIQWLLLSHPQMSGNGFVKKNFLMEAKFEIILIN